MRNLLLLLLALGLAACTPRRGGGGGGDDDDDATGDDDDSVGDDDDSVSDDDDSVGDDDDATGSGGAQPGDLPCDQDGGIVDVWRITLNEGDEVTVSVDTVAAATTFDPAAGLYLGTDPDVDPLVGSGDDDFPCTFPPPEYSCPEFSAFAELGGDYAVVVLQLGCADGNELAAYALRVTVADGGQAVILPQVTFGIAVRMAVMSILGGGSAGRGEE